MANLEPDVHLAERMGRIAQYPIEALHARLVSPGRPITRDAKLTYLERFGILLQLLVNDAKTKVDLVDLLKVCCFGKWRR